MITTINTLIKTINKLYVCKKILLFVKNVYLFIKYGSYEKWDLLTSSMMLFPACNEFQNIVILFYTFESVSANAIKLKNV